MKYTIFRSSTELSCIIPLKIRGTEGSYKSVPLPVAVLPEPAESNAPAPSYAKGGNAEVREWGTHLRHLLLEGKRKREWRLI